MMEKNNFLMLGEEPTDGVKYSTGAAEKRISINVRKAKYKVLIKFTLQW